MNSEGLSKLKKITKDREESLKLLNAALSSNQAFLEYLLNYFNRESLLSEINFSGFKENLSENEFQQLSLDSHCSLLWETLERQKFTSIDATKPIKWLSITFQMIENGLIEPHYLAFVKTNKNGRNNIIEALRFAKEGDNSKLFEVCRAILRHMFGHIQEVGPKGVYREIPFAITWWRIYLDKDAQRKTSIKEEEMYNYFVNNPTNYVELVEKMSGKLTVIADKNILNGFLLYVIDKTITNTKEFRQIIAKIGIESSWRAMGALSPVENKKVIESLVT